MEIKYREFKSNSENYQRKTKALKEHSELNPCALF